MSQQSTLFSYLKSFFEKNQNNIVHLKKILNNSEYGHVFEQLINDQKKRSQGLFNYYDDNLELFSNEIKEIINHSKIKTFELNIYQISQAIDNEDYDLLDKCIDQLIDSFSNLLELKEEQSDRVKDVKSNIKKLLIAVTTFSELESSKSTDLETYNTLMNWIIKLIKQVIDLFGFITKLEDQEITSLKKSIEKLWAFVDVGFKKANQTKTEVKEVIEDNFSKENIKEKLPLFEKKLKQVKSFEKVSFKKLHIEDFIDDLTDFSTIDNQDKLQTVLRNYAEAIDKLLGEFVNIKKDDTEFVDFIGKNSDKKYSLRYNIKHWLTIPEDFRPNNLVELLHHIIKNIKNSINDVVDDGHPFGNKVKTFFEKLDYIFDKIDNNQFKLIISDSKNPKIKRIVIPNSLKENTADNLNGAGDFSNNLRTSTENRGAIKNNKSKSPKAAQKKTYSIGKLIELLCFDKDFGAIKKLTKEEAEHIIDLYNNQWIENRLNKLFNKFETAFKISAIEDFFEDLISRLLNKEGIKLGEFINHTIDKITAKAHQQIDTIRETIDYIINQIYDLCKALINFFLKVDIPDEAKAFIKNIDYFKKWTDEVTLPLFVLTIPYTIFKEFNDLAVK